MTHRTNTPPVVRNAVLGAAGLCALLAGVIAFWPERRDPAPIPPPPPAGQFPVREKLHAERERLRAEVRVLESALAAQKAAASAPKPSPATVVRKPAPPAGSKLESLLKQASWDEIWAGLSTSALRRNGVFEPDDALQVEVLNSLAPHIETLAAIQQELGESSFEGLFGREEVMPYLLPAILKAEGKTVSDDATAALQEITNRYQEEKKVLSDKDFPGFEELILRRGYVDEMAGVLGEGSKDVSMRLLRIPEQPEMIPWRFDPHGDRLEATRKLAHHLTQSWLSGRSSEELAGVLRPYADYLADTLFQYSGSSAHNAPAELWHKCRQTMATVQYLVPFSEDERRGFRNQACYFPTAQEH